MNKSKGKLVLLNTCLESRWGLAATPAALQAASEPVQTPQRCLAATNAGCEGALILVACLDPLPAGT